MSDRPYFGTAGGGMSFNNILKALIRWLYERSKYRKVINGIGANAGLKRRFLETNKHYFNRSYKAIWDNFKNL